MTTFTQVLARLLAEGPSRPLVTFYDDAAGERTELSVTTYANWVAKVSSLLSEELDVEHGDRILVDLPTHWVGTVVLGAAWSCGLEVVWEGDAEAVVTGPDALERWAPYAGRIPVLASALLPLGVRFQTDLPDHVHDLGVEVWSQPDAYDAWPGASDDDPAVAGVTQDQLWRAATAGSLLTDGDRLLSKANPASPSGLASLTGPLASSGSLVLVTHASAERLARIDADERTTAHFDPGQSARS
jgi:uncharacterized protein (TIGR03089 family)